MRMRPRSPWNTKQPGPVASRPSLHRCKPCCSARGRGVSRLEALVALACLSLAALGLAHAQARVVREAEVARVRAQAVRLAHSALEEARSFSTVHASGTARSYASVLSADMPAFQPPEVQVPLSIRREVVERPGMALKAVRVLVTWRDRHGVERSLELDTLLAGAAPGAPAYVANLVSENPLANPLP